MPSAKWFLTILDDTTRQRKRVEYSAGTAGYWLGANRETTGSEGRKSTVSQMFEATDSRSRKTNAERRKKEERSSRIDRVRFANVEMSRDYAWLFTSSQA